MLQHKPVSKPNSVAAKTEGLTKCGVDYMKGWFCRVVLESQLME